MDIEAAIIAGSYGAIFLLMVANGALSVPSSQILYIVSGYFIASGAIGWIPAMILGALGNTIGNIALYEAVRRYGRAAVLRYKLFDPRLLAKVEAAVRAKGWRFLFVGKLLPAIKVFVPIPAGLGKMHRGGFAAVMAAASVVWANIFLFLGYTFGKSFHIFGWYGAAIAGVAGVVVYVFYRYVDRLSPEESPVEDPAGGIEKE